MPDDSPLTTQELQEIERLFSNPLFIPATFKTWMADQLALNIPEIPISSLFGGRGVPRALDSAATAVTAGGNATMYTKKIQGGTLQANGRLRFSCYVQATTPDVSNDVFIDFCLGGSTLCSPTDHLVSGASRQYGIQGEIYNVNDPAVQSAWADGIRYNVVTGSYGQSLGAGSAAVDTRVDQDFEIKARWTSGSADDVVTLSDVQLEIYTPLPFASV